jgi:hypothetical protein
VEGHSAGTVSRPSRNISCPICPRRFATRAALEDHGQAVRTHVSSSQTGTVSQAVVTDHENENGNSSYPSNNSNADAPYRPFENRPLPLSLNGAQSSSAQQDGTQALHSLLATLSISPIDPGLARVESRSTSAERNLGFGRIVLKDDELPDDTGHVVNSPKFLQSEDD